MVEFLTAVKTKSTAQSPPTHRKDRKETEISSAQDALELLKSDPTLSDVGAALRFLNSSESKTSTLALPGPLSAQIVNAILDKTLPDYWHQFSAEKSLEVSAKALASVLRNVSGIGGLLAKLKVALVPLQRTENREDKATPVHDILEVLQRVLQGEDVVERILRDLESSVENETKKSLTWKEFTAIIGGGRILSLAAEAEHVLQTRSTAKVQRLWLADGIQYAHWLGSNLAGLAIRLAEDDHIGWSRVAPLVSKSLTLGYQGTWN